MTKMLNVTHQSPRFGPAPSSRIRPLVRRSLVTIIAAGALVGGLYAPASADVSADSVLANVEVGSLISLSGLSASFTLTGAPGAVATTDTVDYRVTTNNFAGYNVTVEPASSEMTGAIPGNTDTIDIGLLVATTAGAGGTGGPMVADAPTLLHTQSTRSAAAGDNFTTTYSMDIPFVRPDRYTATLDYVATTL